MGNLGRVSRTSLVRGAAIVIGTASALGLLSCSVVTNFDQAQCKVDKDCAEFGSEYKYGTCVEGLCEPGPECKKSEECGATEACLDEKCVDRWACLGQNVPIATEPVAFQVPVADIFGEPMPGIPVKLCNAVDTDCKSPLEELTTDEEGLLTFEVPEAFRGYLDVNLPGLFPQVNFLPEVLTNPSFLPIVSLSPAPIIEALAQQVGDTADPERGHLVVSVASCASGAPNLVISSGRADEKTIPYYVSASVPAPDRTSTTEEGAGGFLNLRVGTGEVRASLDDEQLFSRNVFIRKGTITSVHFQPPALALGAAQPETDEE